MSKETELKIDHLLQINIEGIKEKIESLPVVDKMYKCLDFIRALSESVLSDIKMLETFPPDELTIRKIEIKNGKKSCRFFTKKGLIRYIHTGKLYNYIGVCKYFNITPINKLHIKWEKEIDNSKDGDEFTTKKILCWLFEKRKRISTLGTTINKDDLCKWLRNNKYSKEENTYNKEKAEWLLDYLTKP